MHHPHPPQPADRVPTGGWTLDSGSAERIEITVRAHAGMSRRCSRCRRPAPGYDQLENREWQHVPLWGIEIWFRYAPRRVECPEHGVVVGHLPWNEGKRPLTTAMMGFLARWARRMSWCETAEVFQVTVTEGEAEIPADAEGDDLTGEVCSPEKG